MGKPAIFVLAMTAACSANADIFKCQLPDKTVYQAKPCAEKAINQHILAIETLPPEKIAEAEQRLNSWKADFAVREAAELKAQKEREEALAKQAEIDALRRSAKAQEQMAEAARQPIIINQTPVFVRHPHHLDRQFPAPAKPVHEGHNKPVDRYNRPHQINW